MTYSLDSLDARGASPEVPARLHRLAHELGLMVGLLALLFWMLSLLSYSALDAAWSTTGALPPGAAPVVRNWAGRFGAWLADGSYFLLGLSVWWLVALGLRRWLSGLQRLPPSSAGATVCVWPSACSC